VEPHLCWQEQVSAFSRRVTRDQCYDFKNIFAEKIQQTIGIFDSKQS
jgi:hypothetical protein